MDSFGRAEPLQDRNGESVSRLANARVPSERGGQHVPVFASVRQDSYNVKISAESHALKKGTVKQRLADIALELDASVSQASGRLARWAGLDSHRREPGFLGSVPYVLIVRYLSAIAIALWFYVHSSEYSVSEMSTRLWIIALIALMAVATTYVAVKPNLRRSQSLQAGIILVERRTNNGGVLPDGRLRVRFLPVLLLAHIRVSGVLRRKRRYRDFDWCGSRNGHGSVFHARCSSNAIGPVATHIANVDPQVDFPACHWCELGICF